MVGSLSLADAPDDAVIAEFRARMMAGRFGDRELMTDAERGFHGMWSALCERLVGWEDQFGRDHPVIAEVRQTVHALADARPDAVRVFALNTTRLGRENDLGA
jgi:hypothetical protein